MSSLKNRVQLIGHLGADPEVKNLDSGKKVVTFSMATTESYQSNGEWKEDTQWHRLVAWDRTADRAEQYLHKGSFILVEGKLTHRSYDDSNSQKRYATEVVVRNFMMLDRKGGNSQNSGADLNAEPSQANEPDNSGLPF